MMHKRAGALMLSLEQTDVERLVIHTVSDQSLQKQEPFARMCFARTCK